MGSRSPSPPPSSPLLEACNDGPLHELQFKRSFHTGPSLFLSRGQCLVLLAGMCEYCVQVGHVGSCACACACRSSPPPCSPSFSFQAPLLLHVARAWLVRVHKGGRCGATGGGPLQSCPSTWPHPPAPVFSSPPHSDGPAALDGRGMRVGMATGVAEKGSLPPPLPRLFVCFEVVPFLGLCLGTMVGAFSKISAQFGPKIVTGDRRYIVQSLWCG